MQLNTQTMAGPGLGRNLKVMAIAAGISAVTGEQPIINEQPDYTEIDFTDNQKIMLQNQLASWHSKEPGEIRVNVQPVLLPFYIKKYGIWAGAALAGGFVLGKLI